MDNKDCKNFHDSFQKVVEKNGIGRRKYDTHGLCYGSIHLDEGHQFGAIQIGTTSSNWCIFPFNIAILEQSTAINIQMIFLYLWKWSILGRKSTVGYTISEVTTLRTRLNLGGKECYISDVICTCVGTMYVILNIFV